MKSFRPSRCAAFVASAIALVPVTTTFSGSVAAAPIARIALPNTPAHMPPATGSNDRLYIGNQGNNSITVYAHDAAGNAAPLAVIAGPATQLDHPGQLAQDAAGNLYVANGAWQTNDASVLVFAHGAAGNVAPMRKLAGPRTLIHSVYGMTVDRTTGDVFVADAKPEIGYAKVSVLRFGPSANGDTAPLARSSAGAPHAFTPIGMSLASDSSGQNLIEATAPNQPADNGVGYDLATVSKHFANAGPLNYLATVAQFASSGVADDASSKTFLASNVYGIYRFAENTSGRGPNSPGGPGGQSYTPAPLTVITNDTCTTALAVAPGPTPYTYALHTALAGCANAVFVYANNASGNAVPLRVLSGPATLMNQPFGLYEGL